MPDSVYTQGGSSKPGNADSASRVKSLTNNEPVAVGWVILGLPGEVAAASVELQGIDTQIHGEDAPLLIEHASASQADRLAVEGNIDLGLDREFDQLAASIKKIEQSRQASKPGFFARLFSTSV